MRSNPLFRFRRTALALCLLATALASAPALAATKARLVNLDTQYQRDAAVCNHPRYKGDRDECLSEASTTRSMAEPVRVDPDPGRYARNALKRCEPLPEPDRRDCLARMQGQGTVSGSVAGGGIYRELVTREAEPAVPAVTEVVVPAK